MSGNNINYEEVVRNLRFGTYRRKRDLENVLAACDILEKQAEKIKRQKEQLTKLQAKLGSAKHELADSEGGEA